MPKLYIIRSDMDFYMYMMHGVYYHRYYNNGYETLPDVNIKYMLWRHILLVICAFRWTDKTEIGKCRCRSPSIKKHKEKIDYVYTPPTYKMATPVSLRTLLKTTILRKADEEKKAHDEELEFLPTLINAYFFLKIMLKWCFNQLLRRSCTFLPVRFLYFSRMHMTYGNNMGL